MTGIEPAYSACEAVSASLPATIRGAGNTAALNSQWVACLAVAGEFRSDDFDPYDPERAERTYVNLFIHACGCQHQGIRCPTVESSGYR